MNYIYDIETFPNVFTMAIKCYETGDRWTFEISDRKNQIRELVQMMCYLRDTRARMIGYNNVGFDYPVIHYILELYNVTAAEIYDKSMSIITAQNDDRFKHMIWDNDRIVEQLDLFKIHHFDNVAKFTSLKILEFNMRSASIQDLPFEVGKTLTSEEIDVLISYNHHDVDETEKFFVETFDMIKFREELTEKYSRNFLNHNDTKIGKDFFIMKLEESCPGTCYEKIMGRRQPRQTHRDEIAVKDIIFPYVRFEQPEFNRILDWFNDTVITKRDEDEVINIKACIKVWRAHHRGTKTFGPDCHTEDEAEMYVGPDMKVVKKPLSCEIGGFEFVFGTGGIHGSIPSSIVCESEDDCILDVDVTSYYPSLAIANNLYPKHLGEKFCEIYGDIKTQRVSYAKGTSENKTLKLALNGTFGDTNNRFSPFYDPKYTMAITVNGQLLLCMLAEQLIKVPGLRIIQINTDGITVKCNRGYLDHIGAVCRWWSDLTGLDLEEAFYSRFFVRDVNNYIAEYTESGKLKRKGAYEYELEWHKNHSALVVQKAVEAHLVNGANLEDFIHGHSDVMDFMLRTKVPRSSTLVLDDKPIQNVSRYFVANTGGSLIKIMKPLKGKVDDRRIGINVGYLVQECNDLSTANTAEINYEYYINEAKKLINPLKGGSELWVEHARSATI